MISTVSIRSANESRSESLATLNSTSSIPGKSAWRKITLWRPGAHAGTMTISACRYLTAARWQMNGVEDWRAVYDFWFPPALDADLETHRRMFRRWFGGRTRTELP